LFFSENYEESFKNSNNISILMPLKFYLKNVVWIIPPNTFKNYCFLKYCEYF